MNYNFHLIVLIIGLAIFSSYTITNEIGVEGQTSNLILNILPDSPSIIFLVVSDPDGSDISYSNGDVITVTFDKATNRPPAATKTNLLNLFTFSQNLGDDFTGTWTSASVLKITIVNANNGAPTIGGLTLTVKESGGLRTQDGSSFPSKAVSPLLTGDFGIRAGPSITSLTVVDPKNPAVPGIDAADVFTVRFSENTNQPVNTILNKAAIDALFEYRNGGVPIILGSNYQGIFTNARTLQITILAPDVAPFPTVGGFTLTVKESGNIRDINNLSSPSKAVSPPLSGTFGQAPGPFFLSLVADDPDGGDGQYGAGDTITATFSVPTNQKFGPNLDKPSLDNLFTFSQAIGNDYTGVWKTPTTLVITIVTPTSTAPIIGELQLTVKQSAGLLNQAQTTLPSTATSPALSGNFGTRAGPSIISLVASDPKSPVGNNYDNGDVITITFNEPTNRPPVGSVANLKELFDFKQGISVANLGTTYSGSWTSSSVLKITVSDTTGHTSPTPGSLILTVKAAANLKNSAGTSLASTSTSPPLSGNFGIRDGPVFTSLVASDPANDDAIFNVGDKITARFNGNTNTPLVNSKVALDSLFTFSQEIGDDYSGVFTNPSTLVITILDDAVDTQPNVGELQLTVKQSGGLQLQGGSQASTAVSPVLGGTFGTAPGPAIIDLVAKDPFGSDAVFGQDDIITIFFDVPTNKISGITLPQNAVNELFSFSAPLDAAYTGRWFDSQTFVITFASPGTVEPQIGSFSVTVKESGNIKNKADTSLPSSSSSPVLRGDFGTKAGPAITSVVAADPKTTVILGVDDGDTITITFDEPTNQPLVATKPDIDAVFDFSETIGTDYTGVWFNPLKLVITINNAGGTSIPNPPDLTVSVKNGGNLKNSVNTSLASESIFSSISGNFGQKAGPNIISLVADDPKETVVAGFDDSDTISVIFSEKTNEPFGPTLDKSELDQLFTFSQSIGDDYSGDWKTNGALIITILDGEQLTEPPVVGELQLVVKDTGNLRAQSGSEQSTSVSPFLSGNFGSFIEEIALCEDGAAFSTFPDGKTAEISFAGTDCGGFTFEGADEETSERIEFLGDFVTISPTGGADCSVEPFCTISFVFREDEIPEDTELPIEDNIKIFKDVNDDGDIDQENPDTSVEVFNGLPPGTPQTFIVALDDFRFEASATTPSNSKFAIGGIKALALGGLAPSIGTPSPSSSPSPSAGAAGASGGAGGGGGGGGGNAASLGEEGGFAGAIDTSQVKLYEVDWDKCDKKMLRVIAGPAGPGLSVKAVAAMGGIIAMREAADQPFSKATVYETSISELETFIRVQVEGVIGREASLAQRSFDLKECSGGIGGYSETVDSISPELPVPAGSFPSTASLFEDGSMFDTRYNDIDFGVGYWMPEGQITQMDVDEEEKSITFGFSDKIEDRLVLSLPRGMISADEDKFILINPATSQQISFEVVESGTQYVTLEMFLSEEMDSITVIGTTVVPEFGEIAILVLLTAIVSILVVTRTRQLEISKL